ncbi:hypothetical protein vBPpSSYP_184 [Pseudomonas phage vB_PpS_SYP]|nr:hypothetical protein vBPpSSYP_184 [Pseudomonas phage vB_PpS_SYP]
MSASEWARITDERDDAVAILKGLVDSILNGPSWTVVNVKAEKAKLWLDEYYGEEDYEQSTL